MRLDGQAANVEVTAVGATLWANQGGRMPLTSMTNKRETTDDRRRAIAVAARQTRN
jgi:hypothetical protein